MKLGSSHKVIFASYKQVGVLIKNLKNQWTGPNQSEPLYLVWFGTDFYLAKPIENLSNFDFKF